MPKAKNAKADEALGLYLQGLKLIEIAERLEVPPGTIRRWKNTYKWDNERSDKKANVRKKRGAPPGNKNGKGSPPGNKRAEKFGFLSKYLPDETKEIFDAVAKADPAEILWQQIQIQYAAIIRAQQIAHVIDCDDKTVEIISDGEAGIGYSIQQAWEKQENFLNAQSRAMTTLNQMIARYEKMVSGEQKMQVEKLQAEIDRLKMGSGSGSQDNEFLNAWKQSIIDGYKDNKDGEE